MLKRLKEYKEFIAILVFFFAGGVWLYADFVTKEWLTQEIKLLNANKLPSNKSKCMLRLLRLLV